MSRIAFFAGLALLIGTTCGPASGPTTTQENKTMPIQHATATATCADQLRTIVVRGDLSSGTGLSKQCSRGDADKAFGTQGESGQGRLSGLSHSWLKYRITDDRVARVWLGEHDEIVLVDVAHPGVAEPPAAVRHRFGEPAATIPARHDPTHEEWIYPDRGVTVAVGEGEGAPGAKVSYLFLYAPTTLDDYVHRLGGKDSWVNRRPSR